MPEKTPSKEEILEEIKKTQGDISSLEKELEKTKEERETLENKSDKISNSSEIDNQSNQTEETKNSPKTQSDKESEKTNPKQVPKNEQEKELENLNDLYRYNLELAKQQYAGEELKKDREEKKEWYNKEREKINKKYATESENSANETSNLEDGEEKEIVEERKFDTQKISEEINNKIAQLETERGTSLTSEEKQNIALEMFLEAKENFQKETIESHSWLKRHLEKSQEWWKNLDNSRWGKVTKVAMSTAFLGSTTLLSGSILGIAPSGSFVNRLASRIAIATGLNMAITSNLTGKFFSALKKERGEDEKEENGRFKKLVNKFGIGNIASIGGIGTSFILSGGTVAIIAGTGFVLRKTLNVYFEGQIEEMEKYKKETLKHLQNFNINTLEENLSSFEFQYNQAIKEIEKYKRWKGILNGATTISVGLVTMAATHHAQVMEQEKQEDQLRHVTEKKINDEVDKLIRDQKELMSRLESKETEIKESTSNEQTTQEWMEQILPKKNGDALNKLSEEFKEFKTPFKLEENLETKGSNSNQQIIEGLKQKITEKIEFSSKGAIQTIENLKEQIKHDYPDISKAPHSIQEFMKTSSVKEAIKLGFYNPSDPNGAESALIQKGSVLEFDKQGNLLFHDTKTGEIHTLIKEQDGAETIEKYHGKMFDSDHDAQMNQNPTIIDEQRLKGIEDYERSFETHSMSQDGQYEFIDQGVQHQGNPLKLTDFEEVSKPSGSKDVIENGNSRPTAKEVVTHIETISKQTNEVYKNTINNLFNTKNGHEAWEYIKNSNRMTASTLMNEKLEDINPTYKPLATYLHKLQEVTGLKPKESNWFRSAETNEQYIKRALEKALSLGKIEEVKLGNISSMADALKESSAKVDSFIHGLTNENLNDLKVNIPHYATVLNISPKEVEKALTGIGETKDIAKNISKIVAEYPNQARLLSTMLGVEEKIGPLSPETLVLKNTLDTLLGKK